MARIAIVGVGAIGSVVGAALLDARRHDVTLCAHRTTFERLIIRNHGKVVTIPARPLLDPKVAHPVEWLLLCTKAHQTASAAEWFRALAPKKIAVLQNGIEHVELVAPFAAGATILPVIVRCPVEPLAPGDVNQQGPAALTVQNNPIGAEFATLFDASEVAVHSTDDFRTEAWLKLCQNAVNGAVCGLTVRTIIVMRDPLVADFARKLALECIAVARAEGAKLDDSLAEKIVAQMANIPDAEHHGNSLYYDRRAGRPLEFEARNGVVVRLARKHGIATPLADAAYALLSGASGTACAN
ncbi:MAG TPA: 2-dehydropantoate 2-reductase [Candidatus Binataceae bacterium]|nr:2-dehydropantoate 2-reductase [Candidatus Binataceae bacterium]